MNQPQKPQPQNNEEWNGIDDPPSSPFPKEVNEIDKAFVRTFSTDATLLQPKTSREQNIIFTIFIESLSIISYYTTIYGVCQLFTCYVAVILLLQILRVNVLQDYIF